MNSLLNWNPMEFFLESNGDLLGTLNRLLDGRHGPGNFVHFLTPIKRYGRKNILYIF